MILGCSVCHVMAILYGCDGCGKTFCGAHIVQTDKSNIRDLCEDCVTKGVAAGRYVLWVTPVGGAQ